MFTAFKGEGLVMIPGPGMNPVDTHVPTELDFPCVN